MSGIEVPVAQRRTPTIHRSSNLPTAAERGTPSEGPRLGRGGDLAPLVTIGFDLVMRVTVSLPLVGLVICFVTAVVFQFERVNQTFCNVSNTMPSISAITGFTPQRYIWRMCIALHSMPRFVIGFVYWYYYLQRECLVQAVMSLVYRYLVNLTFFVYVIENACLIGITYIASVENYTVHEKLFITFMVSSLLYELLTIILFHWSHPVMNSNITKSYNLKRFCFLSILLFTSAMLYFFYLHRYHCIPGAFTKFAYCEYAIVVLNITYHYTATYDFIACDWRFVSRPRLKIDSNENHRAH